MSVTTKALASFGHNDIRGTYRDPLLVMIVIAPVIWTVGVIVLTPLSTDMLLSRYDFNLVPYYPLVLTAFLLLTSIIIAGGLAAFLVLDEVDAGTLAALRVTPVPLSTFFAYRAGTVIVVTTAYVVVTLSLSGILEPGLVTALVPIGLLAGLPCIPWFIDSAWNLAFGVLPPYWAAKAFWVASDHGMWWPYLVAGIVYNLLIVWLLFRRFLAKTRGAF